MTTQEIYDAAIANGASPKFAEMLALQQPPGTKGTDTAWMAGRHADPVPGATDMQKRWYLARAKRAGIPTAGKVFMSQLGSAENPEAWVGGLDDLKAVAKKNNLGIRINDETVVKQGELVAPKPVPLAESIIKRRMKEHLAEKPDQDKRQLREKIIHEHAPKWSD